MKMRRLFSCIMALLLVCSLPVTALAETWYLEDGDITVNASADESGTTTQTVTQGEISKEDSAPVITQRDSETSTTNTVTIKAEENATANVTIQDVNIVISDPAGAPKDHSGEAAVTIDVADGAKANVTLDGVNINVGKTGDQEWNKPGEAAVRITGDGNVTIELDGENTVQSGVYRAGVEKNDADSSGNLTITDETGTSGSLEATGGNGGSGIGGGFDGSGSNITITGSAEVTANGGIGGSGIGGGSWGSGSDITITGSAEVTATGGNSGSGIGGGASGSGSDITISGSAQVEATGGDSGSGIGGGYNWNGNGTGSNITVSGDAQVKAQGGNGNYYNGSGFTYGAGAAIGDGGGKTYGNHPEEVKGKDADVTTDAPQDGDSYGLYVGELNEGWIATYGPGEDMDTGNPGSLTYQGGVKVTGATPVAKQEPTCTEDGHEAGFMIDGVLVAVTIPATGHNVPNGTPHNDATCTTLGTMTGYCTNCKKTVTVTDPNSTLKEHTFTTYTPDPDHLATCTEAGTKTAVCDVCKNATDTVIDPAKNHSMGDYTVYKAATCTEEGEERAYCTNDCGYYETRVIEKLKHSVGDYTVYKAATCTEAGEERAYCTYDCGYYETSVINPLGHSFTNYVSNEDATFGSDGTKTAKCDHPGCDVTDTIPDPGTRLERPVEARESGTCYQVVGQNGRNLIHKTQWYNGVLTITVEADYAILTGTLGGMRMLKNQGIDTIVFVTNGASSSFALSDLLDQGSTGDTYMLTHDGGTVRFTFGESGADITGILAKP